MRQITSSKLRGLVLALGVLALAGATAPASAQERHEWRDRDRHEHHWRGGDRDWDGGGFYVGPSYGYYGYAPPPVVYPQPGLSITIPLDIR